LKKRQVITDLSLEEEERKGNGQNDNQFPTHPVVHHLYLVHLARLAHRAISELVASQAKDPTLIGPANLLQVCRGFFCSV